MAAAITIALFTSVFPATVAYAEDIDTNPQADEFQQEVERTAAEYEKAKSQVEAAEKALQENRAHVDELEATIPGQQARSDAAARELYKIEQQSSGIIELLLTSGSFHDFIVNLDYVTRVSQANLEEVKRLASMKEDLETTQSALKKAKSDADAHAKEADEALQAAKEARQEAQRRAQEEARRQAEEAAAAAQAAAEEEARAKAAGEQQEQGDAKGSSQSSEKSGASEKAEKSDSGDKKDGEEGSSSDKSSESQEKAAETEPAPEPVETPSNDGADWSSDQSAFISEWAARIDAYLDGSPMAGQGTTFASAAWSYGVDPRWSPAIACVESTKGANCFASHNAWGWGSSSWGSWEEAIDAHVGGLARGYGYTITMEAAQKYCPPNAETWYNRTVEEMNKI